MNLIDLVGSVGVLLLLLAFALNAAGRLPAAGILYQLLNAIGAGLACAASYLIGFIPFVVLEGTWCLVALVALTAACRRRNARQQSRTPPMEIPNVRT